MASFAQLKAEVSAAEHFPRAWSLWGSMTRIFSANPAANLPELNAALAVFEALGRFPVQPLLEDLELVCAARARGEVRTLTPAVVSSSRRWQSYGVLQNTLHNNLVLMGRRLGVSAATMSTWYYGSTSVKQYS